MNIATGQPENHPTLLSSTIPATAAPTLVEHGIPGQAAVRDTVGEFQGQRVAGEADVLAAQTAGMNAENDRRSHYAETIAPIGAQYGDQLELPVVPDNAVPVASSGLYPYPGDEPVAS